MDIWENLKELWKCSPMAPYYSSHSYYSHDNKKTRNLLSVSLIEDAKNLLLFPGLFRGNIPLIAHSFSSGDDFLRALKHQCDTIRMSVVLRHKFGIFCSSLIRFV